MELVVIGCNFRTTALAEREVWLVPAQKKLPDAVYLATCNRVEIYTTVKSETASEKILSGWGMGQPPGYVRRGPAAFAHLVRVAAGLDSMVLGEPEVFGQVKRAYQKALEEGVTNPLLNFVFQRAFAIAKKIRTETGISRLPVSVSSAGLLLLDQIFGEFEKVRAAVAGLGEMGRQMALGLVKRRVGRLQLFAGNLAKAEAFAQTLPSAASVLPMETLSGHLSDIDLLITSTRRPGQLISASQYAARGSFQVFLDLGVPRNLDPGLGEAQNLFLYNVDDLKTIAAQNLACRQKEAQAAEKIIDQEMGQFQREWHKRSQIVFAGV